MSLSQKYKAVFANWDKEVFRDIHHEDFLFIRETELLTLDDHVENLDKLALTTNFLKNTQNGQLIHENEYVFENRWKEKNEMVTVVILIKKGKAWRQIVNRVPIDEAA